MCLLKRGQVPKHPPRPNTHPVDCDFSSTQKSQPKHPPRRVIHSLYAMEMDLNNFFSEAAIFIEKLLVSLENVKVDVSHFEMDHICYRVETEEQYFALANQLKTVSKLLVEDSINGRLISTFKLESPVKWATRSIFLIELPMPKHGSSYKLGFEHAEFVVGAYVDLKEFVLKYPAIAWDISALAKKINADVRIELDASYENRMSAKFHHLSLEKVIELERSRNVIT